MDVLLDGLSRYGLPGIVLAIFIGLYVKKDRELRLERDARITDVKSYNDLTLKLQSQVIDAINKLSSILDEVRKGTLRR